MRAINSVLAQTYKEFELIVVDDGSTDGTKELLSDLDLKYIYTPNKGVSHARNRGVEAANGKWIAFLDSDDEWLPTKLERQIEYLKDNPDCQLVHGEEIWIRNGVRVNQMNKHKKSGGDIFIRSLKLCLISPSAVILRKELLLQMEGFREDFEVCEDYDLWLKITSLYQVGFIKTPILKKYGGHEDQLSRKFFAMDYWRVKSMVWVFGNRDLDTDKKLSLLKVLKKKCEVLLKGYEKHQNLTHFKEVEGYLRLAMGVS